MVSPHERRVLNVDCSEGTDKRLKDTAKAAGMMLAQVERIAGKSIDRDLEQAMLAAKLLGVPMEQLIFTENEVAIATRRAERFKATLGLKPPTKRRSSAA